MQRGEEKCCPVSKDWGIEDKDHLHRVHCLSTADVLTTSGDSMEQYLQHLKGKEKSHFLKAFLNLLERAKGHPKMLYLVVPSNIMSRGFFSP